jgi:L-ascorbate metabolism protein UlaG (beta-lactamase superfamily)
MTTEIAGVRLTAIPAAHEVITLDESGAHVFLGYVLEVDGVRIYHSGDCVPFDGQSSLLASLDIDVALLPVNGRDQHRLSNGVPGNFTADEAVALCRDAGIPALICHHFGLFDFNTVNPVELSARLEQIGSGLEWTVPAIGAGFHLSPYERNQS